MSYAWNFGDATTGSGPTTSRTYTSAGTFIVKLIVTDGGAASSSQTQSVTVVQPKMHVGDLDRSITPQNSAWTVTVIITILRAPFEYTPPANHDADGDSTGTSIIVQRP